MPRPDMPPGRGAAGCCKCLEVFTSVSAFDHHQKLRPESDGGGVICLDPEERGLVLYEREYAGHGVWTLWGWPAASEGTEWYSEGKNDE
jgi:hypothetical protein